MKIVNPIFRSRFARAFSLVEILSATALVATIAAVSVLSVKDTLMSGQRSAVQKELQNLNTALSNYKSAGGVISDNATARDAVDQLKAGVVLAGSNTEYKPLLNDPDFEVSIGGEVYGLDYAPADGFSYSPASGEGEKFSQAGASEAVGGGGTYPFDITSPTEVAQALQDFAGMDPNDPDYADYINGLNAALTMGGLPNETNNAIAEGLGNSEWVNVAGEWKPKSEVMADLSGMDPSDPRYADYLAGLNASKESNLFTQAEKDALDALLAGKNTYTVRDRWVQASPPSLADYETWVATQVTDMGASFGYTGYGNSLSELKRLFDDVGRDYGDMGYDEYIASYGGFANFAESMFGYPPATGAFTLPQPANQDEWDGLSASLIGNELPFLWNMLHSRNDPWLPTAGQNIDWLSVPAAGRNLSGLNFTGSNVTPAILLSASNITGTDLSGLPLSGTNLGTKSLAGVNLVGTGLTTQELAGATRLDGANLSGLDLAGFSGANIVNSAFTPITYVDASGVTRTLSGTKKSLAGTNLAGTGVTSAGLRSIDNFSNADLSGVNLSSFIDWSASPYTQVSPVKIADGVNLSGASNVIGFVNRAISLKGANLSGQNLIIPNQHGSYSYDTLWSPEAPQIITDANLRNTTGVMPQVIVRSIDFNGVDLRGATSTNGTPITKATLQAEFNAYWGSRGGWPAGRPPVNWDSVLTSQ